MAPSATNVIEHIATAIYKHEYKLNNNKRFKIPRFVYFSTIRFI